MNEKPLIYTSHGNVPEDTLRYEEKWTDTPEMTKLECIWWKGDELVKNNVHILGRKSLDMFAQQAQIQ